MIQTLSKNAQGILDAAKKAADEGGDTAAVDRSVEHAVASLSFSLPQGRKHQVIEALTEIAKAYVRKRIATDMLEGSFNAIVTIKAKFGIGLFLELRPPVQNRKFAVINKIETKGWVDFWNKVGNGDPVGVKVTIHKMRPHSEAFLVEEFSIYDPSNNE